jgi:arginyl-tRNA synthetase
MNAEHILSNQLAQIINQLFALDVKDSDIVLQKTKKEFEGDYTLVTFPYTKVSKLSPEATGDLIGKALKEQLNHVESYNIVKGFLNISLTNDFWLNEFSTYSKDAQYGIKKQTQVANK